MKSQLSIFLIICIIPICCFSSCAAAGDASLVETEVTKYRAAISDIESIGLNGYLGAHYDGYFNSTGRPLAFEAEKGMVIRTERKLDFACFGNSFFQIIDPKSKKLLYTRDGHFSYDSEGYIATRDGYRLIPLMNRHDLEALKIDTDGVVLNSSIPQFIPGSEERLLPGRVFDFSNPSVTLNKRNEVRQGWLMTEKTELESSLFFMITQIQIMRHRTGLKNLYESQLSELLTAVRKRVTPISDDLLAVPEIAAAYKSTHFASMEEVHDGGDSRCIVGQKTWLEIVGKMRI